MCTCCGKHEKFISFSFHLLILICSYSILYDANELRHHNIALYSVVDTIQIYVMLEHKKITDVVNDSNMLRQQHFCY